MLEYRMAMVSDCNATSSDEEHAATLNKFLIYFGDVLTTDETIARLSPTADGMNRKNASRPASCAGRALASSGS
jgi:hypothetical protein